MNKYIALILLVLLPLSGCGALLKTDFTPPETTSPAQWSVASAETSPAAKWPEDFGDPELARLVKLALERNNNLAAAAIKVRKAQYEAGLAWENMTPDLSADLGTDSNKSLKRGEWETSYSAKFGISWEADLWGRLARAHDAAEWEAMATEQDRQSTALSLVGTTMKLYWEIAYDNVRLQLSQSNIESSRQTVTLTESQEQYGATSPLEVSQARQDLANLLATHQTLEQARKEDLNALAVLFDMPPGKAMATPDTLSIATLPAIPAGLPAQLLGRRPDLRAAELRLREYLANTNAAKADFYPPLTLTGSLGSAATELSDMLNNPVATLVSSLTFPFLNWNTLQLKLKVSRAEYEEAVVNFRQTLYEAMREVEDALSNRDHLAVQAKHLAENLDAAREVERIYEVRYKAGSGTLKDWLDAQDTRRTAEKSVAENLYNRLDNYVVLYQALGGEPVRPETGAQQDR
ncbi:efflux transporter outer membrane subunit [Desulfovibrio sp. Huiquan2017]|uniref:efflux transporter outer membrane subunit n=1 Tax=Desulfovibrio sp. Huiquan2017 TaxID=2816861 RepID=UPI001A93632A|nr:efflux transporter outer membrane subunit [Desulfovibrio sp. Huiquan2017]